MSAVCLTHARTFGSSLMAMSFRGPSPKGGRPTRRIDESCLLESSGISEKSIFLLLVLSFLLATRASSTNDSRDLFISSSPYGEGNNLFIIQFCLLRIPLEHQLSIYRMRPSRTAKSAVVSAISMTRKRSAGPMQSVSRRIFRIADLASKLPNGSLTMLSDRPILRMYPEVM